MNTGGTNYGLEMSSLERNFDVPDSPVRVCLTPDVMKLAAALKSPEAAMKLVGDLTAQNTGHLIFNDGITLEQLAAEVSALWSLWCAPAPGS